MGCCTSEGQFKNYIKQVITIEGYQVIKDVIIATGGYAQIWKCKNIQTMQLFALKQIKLQVTYTVIQTLQLEEMFRRQIKILKQLQNNKHTIHMYASKIISTKEFKIGCILMQFGQQSLFDLIKNKKLSDNQIINVIVEVAEAIQQLQGQHICHLDIKPENILIKQHSHQKQIYKLCDFGSAVEGSINLGKMARKQKTQTQQYFQSNSTLIYRSPQMIDLDFAKQVNNASDVWMLGCIIYLMMYRKHPFEQNGKLGILSCNIVYSEGNKTIIQILKGILVRDPTQRFTPTRILQLIKNNYHKSN